MPKPIKEAYIYCTVSRSEPKAFLEGVKSLEDFLSKFSGKESREVGGRIMYRDADGKIKRASIEIKKEPIVVYVTREFDREAAEGFYKPKIKLEEDAGGYTLYYLYRYPGPTEFYYLVGKKYAIVPYIHGFLRPIEFVPHAIAASAAYVVELALSLRRNYYVLSDTLAGIIESLSSASKRVSSIEELLASSSAYVEYRHVLLERRGEYIEPSEDYIYEAFGHVKPSLLGFDGYVYRYAIGSTVEESYKRSVSIELEDILKRLELKFIEEYEDVSGILQKLRAELYGE